MYKIFTNFAHKKRQQIQFFMLACTHIGDYLILLSSFKRSSRLSSNEKSFWSHWFWTELPVPPGLVSGNLWKLVSATPSAAAGKLQWNWEPYGLTTLITRQQYYIPVRQGDLLPDRDLALRVESRFINLDSWKVNTKLITGSIVRIVVGSLWLQKNSDSKVILNWNGIFYNKKNS